MSEPNKKRGRKSTKVSDVVNTVLVNTVLVNTEVNEVISSEPVAKKRGRKPKGGKIVQLPVAVVSVKEEKANVILHLKCFIKDLYQNLNSQNVESFNSYSELSYEVLQSENITSTNNSSPEESSFNDNNTKEIFKKLKQLEMNLHINNINDKKSACFWCTCEFDNPPIYIPKHFLKDSYHVYGCFCSPECGVAHLMEENIDSSTKFERYHLLNHIYSKIYDYKKNIKPAPNPYYLLDKFYGNLSIQEYRALLSNDRLFLIVNKPLTKIMPELHQDNDDFIINNKIIPTNAYNLKKKLEKKTAPNKNSILTDAFGL
jgi:hypothetical protein